MHIGRSRFSRCCYLMGALWFCSSESNLGQAINAVTGTRLWALVFSLPGTVLIWFCLFVLCGCRHGRSAAVVQRFIHVSAHPQVMQQHRQLSRSRNDRSFLSVPPTSLRQLQSPAPEITVDPEWSQNMLSSLHQQRTQIRIAFFADVQLRLALPEFLRPGCNPR